MRSVMRTAGRDLSATRPSGTCLVTAGAQAALERAGPGTLDPTLAWRFLTLGPWMGLVSTLAAPFGSFAGAAAMAFGLASPW